MYRYYLKRTMDFIISLVALPMFLIILIVVGPTIYFSDKGSIFYNADRLGKDGFVFKMYKFRTMRMNAPDIRNSDGSTYNSDVDPRLTRIGNFLRKTSLDEVPQFLNVLKGDMSLIGPRPDLPEHLSLYEGNEVRKLSVRPGLTGYNQALYRNTIPWKERIQNDIYYIDNMTFILDLKIIVMTIFTVVGQNKVYIQNREEHDEN